MRNNFNYDREMKKQNWIKSNQINDDYIWSNNKNNN